MLWGAQIDVLHNKYTCFCIMCAQINDLHYKYKRFDVSEAAPRDATALTGAKRVTGTPGWFRRAGAIGDDAVVQASALD